MRIYGNAFFRATLLCSETNEENKVRLALTAEGLHFV